MTEEITAAALAAAPRIFLVVVDDSPELPVALRYACLRARNCGGRVALLSVIEPGEMQQWQAVEDLMREELRLEAEQQLQKLARSVNEITGTLPSLYVREGGTSEQIMALISEEASISILVLAASTGPDGPGPLIAYFTSRGLSSLRIPLTIVPGNLSDEALAAIT